MSSDSIVLGIDPGLTGMGIVVARLDPQVKSGYDLLAANVVSSAVDKAKKRNLRQSHIDAERAIQISNSLVSIVENHHPKAVFIELPQGGGVSACAVKGMAISMTAVVVTLTRIFLPMEWFDIYEVKRAALGVDKLPKGLDKGAIADAVRKWFPDFDGWPQAESNLFHTTDAAAVLLAARHSSMYTLLARG